MTETMTVAPVVKSVHVALQPRACLRGVHARDRRRGGRSTSTRFTRARCARSSGRSAREARSTRPRPTGSGRTGRRCSPGSRPTGFTIAWQRRSRGVGGRPRSRCASPRRTAGTQVVLEHRHWERLGSDAQPRRGAATTAAGRWCSAATSHLARVSDLRGVARHEAACTAAASDADVDRLGRRAVAERATHELGEAAGSERLRRLAELAPASTTAARTRTRRSAAPTRAAAPARTRACGRGGTARAGRPTGRR